MGNHISAINAAFVDQFFTFVDKRDFGRVEAMLSSDCEIGAPGFAQVGAKSVSQWMEGFFGAFPDLRHSPQRTVIDDENVAVELRVTGTHTGDLTFPDGSSVPPTGRSLDIILAEFWSHDNNVVTQYTVLYDTHDFLVQLGLVA